MSFTVPQELIDRLGTVFPKSTDRVKIAVRLLGYDHLPTRAEWPEIAEITGKDKRTVEMVLQRLVEENLMSSELGSIPLWKIREKERLTSSITSQQAPVEHGSTPSIRAGEYGGLPIYSMDLGGKTGEELQEENTVKREEGEKRPEKEAQGGIETEGQNPRGGVTVPVHTDALVRNREIRELKDRQENLEAVVKAELGGIKDMLEKVISQKAVVEKVEPVVNPVKGKAKPVEDDPPENPGSANPGDPFAGMSKEEVIDFYMNNPQTGRKLPGGLSETFVNAPPATIRKIIVEVTTYTQMLYEKALADAAFEGTFSDFLNWAPAKYFEDRGLSLGWHKVERHPGGRMN